MTAITRELGEYSKRYMRQVRLPELGSEGQKRLRQSRVLVLGAGGLGSPVLQYLGAAGVGHIGIIDDDIVEESNLHRQVLHDVASLGDLKVHSAAKRIGAQVGSEVTVKVYPFRLTHENATELFSEYDLVIDGADNFPTRYLVSDTATVVNVPVVWGSILGFNSQISVFWADPPSELTTDGGVTLRDVFPNEPAPGSVLSCAEAGVIGALCGQAGSVMAMEALKLLGHFGEPLLGRVLLLDALKGTSKTIPIRPGGRAPALRFPNRKSRSGTTIAVEEINTAEWLLVDVRENDEFSAGHAAGAVFMPLSGLTYVTAHAEARRLERISNGRKIALYCQAGIRSQQAEVLLTEAGLEGVHLLKGDYPAWKNSGAPIEFGESSE